MDFCPCEGKDRSKYYRISKVFDTAGAKIRPIKPMGFDSRQATLVLTVNTWEIDAFVKIHLEAKKVHFATYF